MALLKDCENDCENDSHPGLGVLPGEDRSNVECRETCIFNSSEMSFNIVTADWYPVRPLSHEVKNINQACLVVDQPSMALQAIHQYDMTASTFKRRGEQESSKSCYSELENRSIAHCPMATDR